MHFQTLALMALSLRLGAAQLETQVFNCTSSEQTQPICCMNGDKTKGCESAVLVNLVEVPKTAEYCLHDDYKVAFCCRSTKVVDDQLNGKHCSEADLYTADVQ